MKGNKFANGASFGFVGISSSTSTPSARHYHSMALNPAKGQIFVFGGKGVSSYEKQSMPLINLTEAANLYIL